MKKCPACGYVSIDEDAYCPNDGAILTDDTSLSPFDTPTQFVPTPARQTAQPERARSPMIFIAIGAMGATIIALVTVLYLMSGSTSISGTEAKTNGSVAGSSNSPASVNDAAPVTNPTNASQPAPAVRIQANNRQPELPNYAPGEAGSVPATGETWFIVLGSYPHHEEFKADERLRHVQGRGITATKVDTGDYPGFRKGYYSVVAGPFSKSESRRLLPGIKSVVADAYVRSGW